MMMVGGVKAAVVEIIRVQHPSHQNQRRAGNAGGFDRTPDVAKSAPQELLVRIEGLLG